MVNYDHLLQQLFWEKYLTPVWEMLEATCPGSKRTQSRVCDEIIQDLFNPTIKLKHNKELNRFKKLEADLILLGKKHIEEYCNSLKHSNNMECSPILDSCPILSKKFLSRLTLWLMKNANNSTSLVVRYSLDLDPEIIDAVLGSGHDRIHLLKNAKAEFKLIYDFFKVFTKEKPMPQYLISALLGRSPCVSPSEESLLMRTDLHYCRNLIDAIII